ncbi:AraC family transcriptional regulator [Paenibacillus hemerocallicola]|uniref:AraC family transcriptional regulator n=1 Tax=Paenibacillus hemerocallicola TaxID=1172614 RepID=A0A5C4T4F0_9BACL|nr:AraC family transcriptional regulator [Paenibacillus hemerocallicola]TNJ63924.1 AraC family transcriptional regulator [Paenibacillus hemerocallicola]
MTPEANTGPLAEVLQADYAYHFKPYQTSRRKLNYYYFRLQVEGQCQAIVHGEMTSIHPGDLLLYRPGDIAAIQFVRPPEQPSGKALLSGNYYMSCRGAWLDEWWALSNKPQKLKIPLSESVLTIFKEIVQEQRRWKDKKPEVSDYLLRVLCLMIERNMHDLDKHGKNPSLLVQRMKQYIMEHATSPLRLEDVARDAGISVPRAVSLFKSAFNQTIMQYVLEVRLSIARDRIKFTMTNLERIAESAGFGSYTYFHRVFRSKYGISPKQYRDQY